MLGKLLRLACKTRASSNFSLTALFQAKQITYFKLTLNLLPLEACCDVVLFV